MKNLQQVGDTIVEVLLALAVLSVVLAGAYASSAHSLNNIRQSQERIEALKIAEGQLESLDTLGKAATKTNDTSTSSIFGINHVFCIDTNNGNNVVDATSIPVLLNTAAPPATVLPSLQSDTSFDITPDSYVDNCRFGTDNRYHVAIERSNDSIGSIFTVHIRWDAVGGNGSGGHDEVLIRYRLNRP